MQQTVMKIYWDFEHKGLKSDLEVHELNDTAISQVICRAPVSWRSAMIYIVMSKVLIETCTYTIKVTPRRVSLNSPIAELRQEPRICYTIMLQWTF